MRIFAKRVNKFDPTSFPFVEMDGVQYSPGAGLAVDHAMVFVGDTTDETIEGDRGRLLGIAEIINFPIDSRSLLGTDTVQNRQPANDVVPMHLLYFPIVRAWEFRPRLKAADALNEHLPFALRNKVVNLPEQDVLTVLALPKVELSLPPLLEFLGTDHNAGDWTERTPTTGPTPGDWLGVVQRTANREAWTYVMRFGLRNVWKVGHTQNLETRLSQINEHVPYEDLKECWSLAMERRWESSVDAYLMEQQMLKRLSSCRTAGERVLCPEEVVRIAWDNFARMSGNGCSIP
jgi:hypothetical protein